MTRLAAFACAILFPATVFPQTFGRELGPADRFYKRDSPFSLKFDSKKEGGAVRWTAERQELVKDDYVILEGQVKIFYQDVELSGDKITHNLKTKDVVAEGHVILDQGSRRLSAEKAVYNLESKTGTLFEARGSFEPSIYFTGKRIEKLNDTTYRLTDGIFTSCDIDNPSWSFHLASGVVTVNDYARLRDLSFRARRIPLFWTPYLVWPTKHDRSRGLLIPKPGYSNRFGAFLKTQYFIPFGSSADATLSAELYGKGYYELGVESRYKPSTVTDGKLTVSTVRDAENDKFEWKYSYQHKQERLPGGFRGVIDVRDFSDLNFFQTFERRFELNTLSNVYSSAYLTKNRPTYSLNIRADRREHFLGASGSRVFEQLPSVEFRTYPNRVGSTPLYFSLESSAAHLRTSLGANYYRGDFNPTLTLQLRTPSWLSVKPQLSLRQTYYTSSVNPATQQLAEDSLSRFYAQGEVEVVGPSFSKIFNRELGGFNKFKHVIEPRVRYLYTTNVEEQNRVIRFDTVDSPVLPLVRDLVEYSVTQRIIGKEQKENASARDIMSLTARQSVSLSEPFGSTGGRVSQRFSPLTITAHVNPYQSVTVDGTLTYGNESHQLDQTSLSASLLGKNAYLNLTWFASYLRPGLTAGDSSQIRFSTGAPLWTDKLRLDTQINYDAKTRDLLEQRFILGMFSGCYTVSFEYRDFLQLRGFEQPTRTRDYQVAISLKNVGTFVDFRGSLDNVF